MQKPGSSKERIRNGIAAKLWWVVAIICVSAGFFYLWPTKDFITFSPTPTPNEKAVLIDGVKDGVFKNDWDPGVVSAATNSVVIGEFTANSSTNSGEVVVFSPGKAPFIKTPIPWSIFSDTINVDFHDLYDINVKIWMLTDLAFNVQIAQHCQKAQSIWNSEGHGLQITCDIQDAREMIVTLGETSGRAAVLYSNRAFDCDDTDASNLKNSTAYTAGFLNVYYVNRVTTVLGSGEHYGVHCVADPDVIALGAANTASVMGLLAHEIGHALIGNGSEDHIDELSPSPQCPLMPPLCTGTLPNNAGGFPSFFDRTNVMHGASSWRATLTEGQVFRAFFNRSSVLNQASIYNLNLNPGGMGRPNCGGVGTGEYKPPDPTPECPRLDKRLWPDIGGEYGTWPAN